MTYEIHYIKDGKDTFFSVTGKTYHAIESEIAMGLQKRGIDKNNHNLWSQWRRWPR